MESCQEVSMENIELIEIFKDTIIMSKRVILFNLFLQLLYQIILVHHVCRKEGKSKAKWLEIMNRYEMFKYITVYL